jgi:predicted nucleic acid-binding protein
MNLLVDTSVWSLALRRDPPLLPELGELRRALAGSDLVVTTGIIVQELLQGIVSERSRSQIRERMSRMGHVAGGIDDHTDAADAFIECRRRGVQLGTVDALLATLCIRRGLTLLTTDRDFLHAAPHLGLRVWRPA